MKSNTYEINSCQGFNFFFKFHDAIISVTFNSVLFFQSCEVLEDKPEVIEDNKSAEVKPEKPIEITKVTPPEKEEKEPEPQKPVVIEQKPTPDKKPNPPKPEKAGFTWNYLPQ